MKTRLVMTVALGILLSFGLGVPALASAPPQHGTFAMGALEIQTDPGQQFLTGNILHIRGGVAEMGVSPLPWGTPMTSTETVIRSEGDITTGLGTATSATRDVYGNGVVLGNVHTSLDGLGFWTYPGPDVTFMGQTLRTGQTFFGLLMHGSAVKHGVSGELKGLETRETFTSVLLLDFSGPMPISTGVNPGYATGTYTWLDQPAYSRILNGAGRLGVDVQDASEDFIINLGDPDHHPGYVGWSQVSGWHRGCLVFAPVAETGIRMRVRLFTTVAPK